ncbi:MAG: FAD/FMN-containing dehydrogenase [Saprospiraceae bacterium]|jgi:FAD/FMN-containing dehydrogenase
MPDTIQNILINKLGKDKALTDKDLSTRYVHIWKMNEPLTAKCVVLPKTTEEVAEILKICHAHQQPVVVHGGLTNLVGSTNTQKNEVVISLEKMNQIEEIDEQSRTITVQAGVILENVHNAVEKKNLLFPLNFGAKGSAQVGGIIATNAGGLRVFRYGMTRNLVLGLEAVLADGTIVSSLKKIIKDNSAYDLKQLFIGSEGTLGIVTKAVLKLVEAPKSRNSAFVAFNDYDKVVDFLKYMDGGLAGTLSGFELIWKKCYEGMTTPPAKMKPPLPYSYNYYVLMESLGNHQENDRQKMQDLLEIAFEKELILDAALAHTEADLQWFWTIREDVHAIASQANHDHHFDISLPISVIGKVIPEIEANLYKIPEVEVVYCFGHVADGNIHLIVGKENGSKMLKEQIDMVVYSPLKAFGGSVSAEHGIGVDKKAYLHLCRSETEINLMKTIKRALDPNHILNRGKIFD